MGPHPSRGLQLTAPQHTTSLPFLNVPCSLLLPGFCTGCPLPPPTLDSCTCLSLYPPPWGGQAPVPCPPSTVPSSTRELICVVTWGAGSTLGLLVPQGGTVAVGMAEHPCLPQSRLFTNVCQRKRTERRVVGHTEGTLETWSSQEGKIQVPGDLAWPRPGEGRGTQPTFPRTQRVSMMQRTLGAGPGMGFCAQTLNGINLE